MRPSLSPLPIDSHLPAIRTLLEENRPVIVEASPGSGKTTRIPSSVLASTFLGDLEILVLEPRRLAAKLAARRVAWERGESVGDFIGYHFRFEKVVGKNTRVTFLTEGMLIRRLLTDPQLARVGCVLIDEFHERHLHGDIALSYLAHLRKNQRPDLRIAVMSATLDTTSLAGFLDNACVVSVAAPRFPIDIDYLSSPSSKPLAELVKAALMSAIREIPKDENSGDILVFLPGMNDILKSSDLLQPLRSSHDLDIFVLHGELDRERQDAALKKSARRKVILSTNIAESSLTIEGISIVIDSGLQRSASYSWWSGVPSLTTKPVSRASAIQRAGRAGRTGPGKVFRLYPKGDFEGRPQFETPEILRADLSQTVLELKSLGIKSISQFPWLERPSLASIEGAETLLYRLGALSRNGDLTPLGKTMVGFPAHPRLSRLLLESEQRGVLDLGTTLAAMLSEGSWEGMDAIEATRKTNLPPSGKRLKQQFLNAFENRQPSSRGFDSQNEDLAKCVLASFPDRVGKKRKAARGKTHEVDVVFASGGSARVVESGIILESELFVALDIQEQKHQTQQRSALRLRSVCAIHEDWLLDTEPSLIQEHDVITWDDSRQRVVVASQVKYGDLVLTESSSTPKPSEETFSVLLKEGLYIDKEKITTLDPSGFCLSLARIADAKLCESWIARLLLMTSHLGTSDWPQVRDRLLGPLRDKLSLEEAKAAGLPETWISILPSEQQSLFDRLVPTSLLLPSGRRSQVVYSIGSDPFVASRLQDFFGWSTGPSLLNGKVPLTIHLLAPNHRAVQVTKDLKGFWEREYPRIRKELGRKYPRHAWPEDPTVAVKFVPKRR